MTEGPTMPGWNELIDAMTQRSLDLLAARSWLLHFGERTATTWIVAITTPTMPVVDADGDAVVVALCWWLGGVPFFITEFDNGVQRHKVYDEQTRTWREIGAVEWERLLIDAHSRGLFAPPAPDAGPMDTRGAMNTGGAVGITVIRGGESIPVDPETGLGSEVTPLGGESLGDEAEAFLRDNTRGE